MATDILNKYIWLAETIFRAKRITFNELNSKWESSGFSLGKSLPRRTFCNYRVAIEQLFDIDIACDNSTNEYYIKNADEFCGNNLTNWLLNSFSITNLARERYDVRQRIVLEETPSAQTFLKDFISSIRENKVVTMTYHPYWSESAFEIELHPYFVKLYNQRWYVYGRSDNDEKIKVYALDRVLNLSITHKCFLLPPDFSAVEHLFSSIGIIKNEDDEPCQILIKAHGETSRYLNALPIHHSQKRIEECEEYALFSYWLSPTDDFYQEILYKREYVEVVSPDFVRAKLAEIVGKLYGFYVM